VGLFKELVLLPLAPVRGTLWVTEQIAQEAEAQLYDEDRIKRELIQLDFEEQAGRISKEERERIERDLFERLAIARQRAAGEMERPMTSGPPAEYEVVEDG
jgi:Gas vesicle protein G